MYAARLEPAGYFHNSRYPLTVVSKETNELTFWLRPPKVNSHHSALNDLLMRIESSRKTHGLLILMPALLVVAFHLCPLASSRQRYGMFRSPTSCELCLIRHSNILKNPSFFTVKVMANWRKYIISSGFVLYTPTKEIFSAGPFLALEVRLHHYATFSFHRLLLGRLYLKMNPFHFSWLVRT